MYDIFRSGESVFKLCSVNEIGSGNLKNGVYSLHLERSKLDWLIKGVEAKSSYFLVCFSGAITNRCGSPAPFFSGVNIRSEVKVPLLAFSDPTLSLSPDLPLAWYSGHQDFPHAPDVIARVIERYSKVLGATPILFGASGGGFACLAQSRILTIPHFSFVWNPQTSISEYNLNFVYQYLEVAFPDAYSEIADLRHAECANRVAYEFMDKMGIYHSVLDSYHNPLANILYIQNESDWHVKAHLQPYLESKRLKSNQSGIFYNSDQKVMVSTENWGQGHVSPPKEVIVSMLKNISSGASVGQCVRKLQSLCRGLKSAISKNYVEVAENFRSIFWFSNGSIKVFCGFPGEDNTKIQDFSYAFYLFVDGEKRQVTWYQKEPFSTFDIGDLSGVDVRLEAFAKSPNGNVSRVSSQKIDCYGVADHDGGFLVGIDSNLIDFGLQPKCFGSFGEIIISNEKSSIEFDDIVKRHRLKNIVPESLAYYKTSGSLHGCKFIAIKVDSPEGDILIDWTNPRLSLDLLVTEDEGSFMERFTYASKRHYDDKVVSFIAKNNIESDVAPKNVKINSSVIFAYKELEKPGWQGSVDDLIVMLDQAESYVEDLPGGFGARKDKVHLVMSVVMAKFHVLLPLKSYTDLIALADKVVDLVSSADFRGYYSVNFVKMMAIAAFSSNRLKNRSDEERFLQLIIGTVPKVDKCIEDEQPGWLYSERKYVDSLAAHAHKMLSGGESFSDDKIKLKVLDEAVRVKESHYLNALGEL
ncbi:hypothetical protein [Marinobacter lipolyticus]|uniref:hypothetical protein n=1 Tax=Marinobacter lipolyticus TaxID=209639 RepID=UPI003A91B426